MANKPFFSWRHALLASPDLSSNEKLVALVISTYMNDHGQGAFPSQETIATKASINVRSVKRAAKSLQEKGWITRRLHGYAGQKWKRHDYEICMPKRDDTESPPSDKGGDTLSKGGDTECKKVVTESHLNSPKNSPIKKEEDRKKEIREKFTDDDYESAVFMFNAIRHKYPDTSDSNLDQWADDIRKMREIDKREPDRIAAVFLWAHAHDFWSANIRSPSKLRKQWSTLCAQKQQEINNGPNQFL